MKTSLFLLPSALAYSAFMINVKPHEQNCFYETLATGDRLDLSFQVADGGHLDIDFWVKSPDSRNIYSVNKQSTSTFGFNADSAGKYVYCFSNQFSTFAHKQVSFTLFGPDERIRLEDKKKNADPNHEGLQKEIWALAGMSLTNADGLRAMKDEQSYMVVREATHRLTAESTKTRIVYWSLFEMLILVGVCLFQVSYLKRFFEVKRVI